ncbi:ATP-dependent helicase HrpB [Chryseolinea sp. H1M3-3]|uniref:ATP-dependent helicase HrpB n=1 Tax=Chryseolinea sp. H1M3-3 TaxID=3034144 RepID=UPI0023EB44E9|nr:ATP-dependent helicase HrpB [Chryseolinea sp. H1M3-3]
MSTTYPVEQVIGELTQQLQQQPIVILQAPPGAGKSTILPLLLLNESWLQGQKMVMLEPRKLAARSVAIRMARLLKEDVGNTIGYRVRFENAVGKSTRCEVVTEGILTRMMQSDNTLEGIGLVIFDEFHERSLQADLALALCLQLQQVLRNDLRILIMSATLDGDKISAQLNNAPIITTAGRQFPVALRYTPVEKNIPIPISTARIIRKALQEQEGDILTFLPGIVDIHRVAELLENENVAASVHPLYGDLPFQKQQEAILPNRDGTRKVVLATSIAETSLTIEGITTVVDSGLSRVPRFDPRSGLTRLETIRVTKDAADQRAGRAGRLGPGVCYRLWAEAAHHTLQPTRQPEILEADLAPLLLELANWGIEDSKELAWITPPPSGAINQARALLQELGALQGNKITARGKEMLRLPTHPRIAHMLLEASAFDTTDTGPKKNNAMLGLAIDIASILEERDPLSKDAGADLSLRVEVLRKWRRGERVNAERNTLERIERLVSSWTKIFKISQDDAQLFDTDIGRLLAEAYPERIARQIEKHGTRYKLVHGRVAKLPDHDALMRNAWLAIAQLDSGSGEGKIFMAAPLRESDLIHRAQDQDIILWDHGKGIIATREKRIGNVILSSKPLQTIPVGSRIDVLIQAFQQEGLKILSWNDEHRAWQARVMSVRLWRPEESWPDVSDDNLLHTAHDWLAPFLLAVYKPSDFQRLNVDQLIASLLPWELTNRLDQLAPNRIEVPSGSMITINYSITGETPTLEVRLQEMFGLLETPTVNGGRTKVMLHLLSPGYKPVQVTQDLKSFWQTTYHEVRKELRMRYPRHSWPEDPWTAEAVRGARKKV